MAMRQVMVTGGLPERTFCRVHVVPSVVLDLHQMLAVDSVRTLLDHASRSYFTEPRGHWVFRGHSDIHHKLIPSVGRGNHTSKSREKYERSLFDIFRREAYGILAAVPADEWEWLSLAQHHGLPTRLLDFTQRIRWQHKISSPFH